MSAVLEALAAAAGARDVALRHGDRSLTRGELAAAIERSADDLARRGLAAGESVALSCADPIDAVVAVLAARRAGALGCPVAPDSRPPAGLRWAARLHGGELTVRRLGDGVSPPVGAAWLRATTGSSGARRCIAFSEPQALAAVRRNDALLGPVRGQTVLTTLSPCTGYGWNGAVLGPLLAGAEVRFVSPLAPRDVLQAFASGRVAWAVATAAVVCALVRLSPSVGAAGGRLLVSAAPYPRREAESLRRRHGLDVYDRYGATEAGPIAQAREPGGALHPAPGVDVQVAGDPAVVEVRSDGVALGALGGAPFGWVFRTSDRAEVLVDGGFRLAGRADRVVRRAGRSVDLAHVEATLAGLPGVSLARVRAEPGGLDLDLQADVVPAAGASLDVAALGDALSRLLPPWERPRRITVRGTVPGRAGDGKWTAA